MEAVMEEHFAMFGLMLAMISEEEYHQQSLVQLRRLTKVVKKRKPRRWWSRPWIKARSDTEHVTTMHSLQMELVACDDTVQYRSMMRMDRDTYLWLLNKVEPLITKQRTRMREPIPPCGRLSATLKVLAFGDTLVNSKLQFRYGTSTLSYMVPAVCAAIYQVLHEEFLDTPRDEKSWRQISLGFWKRWNFPNCVGSLDGKHITIVPPKNSGSLYYNYKGTYSVVLMALVDHNYEFVYVDVGAEGRVADGGIWDVCTLHAAIEDGSIGFPPPEPLPGTEVDMPFTIVAYDAFPLRPYIMKPFSRRDLSDADLIFNYRLSRARRTVENAFGIMANRFRIFFTRIGLGPDTTEAICLACTCLHNMLRRRCGKNYLSPGSLDRETANFDVIPGDWRSGGEMDRMRRDPSHNPSIEAKVNRTIRRDFFLSEAGSVPWQWASVGR